MPLALKIQIRLLSIEFKALPKLSRVTRTPPGQHPELGAGKPHALPPSDGLSLLSTLFPCLTPMRSSKAHEMLTWALFRCWMHILQFLILPMIPWDLQNLVKGVQLMSS